MDLITGISIEAVKAMVYLEGDNAWAEKRDDGKWSVHHKYSDVEQSQSMQVVDDVYKAYRLVKPRAFSKEAWQRLVKAGLADAS